MWRGSVVYELTYNEYIKNVESNGQIALNSILDNIT